MPAPQAAPATLLEPDVNQDERSDEKECPRCAELIKRKARYCRFCQYEFTNDEYAAEMAVYEAQQKAEQDAEAERRLREQGVNYKGYNIKKTASGNFQVIENGLLVKGSQTYDSLEAAKAYIKLIEAE